MPFRLPQNKVGNEKPQGPFRDALTRVQIGGRQRVARHVGLAPRVLNREARALIAKEVLILWCARAFGGSRLVNDGSLHELLALHCNEVCREEYSGVIVNGHLVRVCS